MSPSGRIERSDWAATVDAFREFFDCLGDVVETGDEVRFDAGFTGLVMHRNGTSRSFMPLHDLSTTWQAVEFDDAGRTVTLIAGETRYTYKVPPQLLD
jgi:hypothetical protein